MLSDILKFLKIKVLYGENLLVQWYIHPSTVIQHANFHLKLLIKRNKYNELYSTRCLLVHIQFKHEIMH